MMINNNTKMTSTIKPQARQQGRIRAAFIAAGIFYCLCHPLKTMAANSLEEITFNTLSGNRLQIAIQLAEPASEPLSFTINDPARIVLDLPNTKNALSEKVLPIGLGLARSINTAEGKERTRVVLNMTQLVPYKTEIEGNTIYLTLENEIGASGTLAATQRDSVTADAPIAEKRSSSANRSITDIDFRRGEKGEARIIVGLSNTNIPVDVNEEGGKLIIDFRGTQLPDRLARRLDVLDFATPAKTIDAFQYDGNVRLIVSPVDNNFEHLAYQSDDLFTLELKPIPKEIREQQIKEKFGYTGERLSLNFQDIEVRSVLQLIADFTNLNVVVSDTVSGKLTLRLKNVPWDQALDIILDSKGLAMRKSGNVLLIAPTEEIATREKLELEAMQQVQELAPLRSEYIQINYAKASDLAALLSGGGGGSLLSGRGRVSIDQRTNTLLVQETAENLEEIRALVARLDIPVRQVLIESRIVIANDDFNKDLGVRFGVTRDTLSTDPNLEGTVGTGNLSAVTDILNGDPIELNDRMNVNLPVAGSFGNFALALAKLPLGTLLELELSALQAEGRGEIISSPRVITANQKEAFIEQGVEIPYQEASSSGATSVSFKKAVLSLTVTPQITPDDRIIMDLTVNNDTVGEVFAGIPSIDTREINTQVLVNNGETVVLGGIFEHSMINQVDKVPFFGDLPGIGRLFRRTITEDDKSELLIFVTPKIIKESLALD
jgi:type IV pilus assembly protein PilQ